MNRAVAVLATLFVVAGTTGSGLAREFTVTEKQRALDTIAAFAIPPTPSKPGAPYLPGGPFSSWSSQDQLSVPKQVAQACEALWVMYHDDESVKFLPEAQPEADEEALGLYVCLAGHMPDDWPDRTKVTQPLHDIFQRAHALGSGLTLPRALP